MRLFKRKIEPRNDPRHVPEMEQGAVLTAMLLSDSCDCGMEGMGGLIGMGSWMDSDYDAFMACLVAKMNSATQSNSFSDANFLIEKWDEIRA
jgi:hypothetical protein